MAKKNQTQRPLSEAEEKAIIESGQKMLAKSCLKAYFPDRLKSLNLRDYTTDYGRIGEFEVTSRDEKQGYVFVGELQVDRDVERRLKDVRKKCEAEGKTIERYLLYLDDSERMGALCWRQ